jgi:hypothetical protein
LADEAADALKLIEPGDAGPDKAERR